MRMLRRMDADGPMVIRERPIPMRPHAGGVRLAQQLRRRAGRMQLQRKHAAIRKIGIKNHPGTLVVGNGMPCIPIRQTARRPRPGIQRKQSMRPVHQGKLTAAADP